MEVTKQRLETFNPKEKGKFSIEVIDLTDNTGNATGTEVLVRMPSEKE